VQPFFYATRMDTTLSDKRPVEKQLVIAFRAVTSVEESDDRGKLHVEYWSTTGVGSAMVSGFLAEFTKDWSNALKDPRR